MLLVVLGILSLVLAFEHPPYELLASRGLVISFAVVATVLPPALAAVGTLWSLRELDRDPEHPERGQDGYAWTVWVAQMSTALLHAGLLIGTSWLSITRSIPVVGEWIAVPSVIAMVPFLMAVVLVWVAQYPADRALRQLVIEHNLFHQKPVHPVWTLPRALNYQLRHQLLFVLIPMVLILAVRDAVFRYAEPLRAAFGHDYVPDLLLGLAAVFVAVIAPLILRWVWVTQSLPRGPLRDRLEFLCSKLKMRCRDILIWHSDGMIVNAAVMGVIAPFRYVMITDAMLEQMEDTRIEAVFGHEAGHVKKQHILYFLLYAFISGCLVTIAGHYARAIDRETYQILVAVLGGVLLLKWGVVFGWISRAFERQADLYGVRTLALAGMPCAAQCAQHTPLLWGPSAQRGDALCVTSAEEFGRTLVQVADANGIPPRARSWRHGSIASRATVVGRYARDPLATARFEAHVGRIKTAIAVGALVSAIAAVWTMELWTLVGIGADAAR